jgi:hypothetical protein
VQQLTAARSSRRWRFDSPRPSVLGNPGQNIAASGLRKDSVGTMALVWERYLTILECIGEGGCWWNGVVSIYVANIDRFCGSLTFERAAACCAK